MDHHTTTTTIPSSTKPSSSSASVPPPPDRALLAAIESAVERCTAGAGDDDDNHRHVHEILFLVSNSPGAITFLSRRITSRLESPRAAAAVAIRSLLLVHRLLRAGDRYFEQDLRSLWSSRDLRLDSLLCSCSPLSFSSASGVAVATGACAFVHGYSAYLEERMLWVINQAGNLEPAARRRAQPSSNHDGGETTSPAPAKTTSNDGGDGDGEGERLVWKLGMCQRLLDLAMQLLPDNNTSSGCAAARSAFGIVLRESFKVYETFAEGLDAMMTMMMRRSSRKTTTRKTTMRVSAHEVLKKACVQTVDLKEFYHKCKRMSNASKGLEYPLVRVVTPAMASAVMEMDPTMPIQEEEEEEPPETEAESSGGGGGGLTFASKMETTISTVWVEFEEDDKLMLSGGDGDDRSLESRAAKRS
ncbi:hypothetical protein HU200_016632 [Digitaria exilis]|uniref:ENTH domain-containing protein n=1 Tax=Digitaria exilis TaxID=1010633 RepID=A0A835F7P3_9POAL|nr:hypothetical protein HU200_016632 [Digitaria exilis]